MKARNTCKCFTLGESGPTGCTLLPRIKYQRHQILACSCGTHYLASENPCGRIVLYQLWPIPLYPGCFAGAHFNPCNLFRLSLPWSLSPFLFTWHSQGAIIKAVTDIKIHGMPQVTSISLIRQDQLWEEERGIMRRIKVPFLIYLVGCFFFKLHLSMIPSNLTESNLIVSSMWPGHSFFPLVTSSLAAQLLRHEQN